MTTIFQQLIGLHRAEFGKASALQARILFVQAVQVSIAVLSVFISNATVAYVFALISCAAACVWIWLWAEYKASRGLAERVRRLTLVADGLGMTISEAELLQIKASFSVSEAEAERLADRNYYDVAAGAGPARLAGMIEQSAFWSAYLLRKSAVWTWVYLAGTIACILALLVSIPLMDADAGLTGARIACAAILFPLSSDFLGAALSYRSAAAEVEQVKTRLLAARTAGTPLPDVLTIMGDYNAAVEGAPMFVRGVYKKHNERLNWLWAEYQAGVRRPA